MRHEIIEAVPMYDGIHWVVLIQTTPSNLFDRIFRRYTKVTRAWGVYGTYEWFTVPDNRKLPKNVSTVAVEGAARQRWKDLGYKFDSLHVDKNGNFIPAGPIN